MSNISFEGFEELIGTLDSLGQVANKVTSKALREGSKVVLDAEKKETSNWSENSGKLSTGKLKRFKNGGGAISVGITKDNWNDCRGLWYQNFNGIHSSGKHIGWITKAYEKSKKEAAETMIKVISDEVDKILK